MAAQERDANQEKKVVEAINGKKALLWAAANSWTNNLLSLAIMSALARLVAPEDFGLVALAAIVIALGQVVVNDTVDMALVQRKQLDDDHLHTAYWIMVAMGFGLWLIGFAVAPLLTAYFSEPRLAIVIPILSARLVFDAMQAIPLGLISRRLDFKVLAIRSFVANVVAGVIGVTLALLDFGVWALVAQQLSNAIFSFAVCLSGVEWRPRFVFSPRHAHELVPFSVYLILTRACYFASGNIDRFLIGRFIDVSAVGYYSFARRVQEMAMLSLNGVMSQFSFPFFSGGQADRAIIVARVFAVADAAYFVICPAFAGLAAVAPDLMPALFGGKWGPAVPILQVLALHSILASTTILHETVVKALGRADWWLALTAFGSVLNVAGYFIAAPHGVVAVAISILAVSTLVQPIHWCMVWRLLSFNMLEYIGLFAAPLLAATAMAIIVAVFRDWAPVAAIPQVARLVLEIAVGSIIYLLIAFAFFRARALQIAQQFVHF